MKTRDEIITSMCYTWRHDFGLDRIENPTMIRTSLTGGMAASERENLRRQMAQLFDNSIAPYMDFKNSTT